MEGPTLAERIALGPIPLDEALPIALQIAEALEYAHEKGIVHRDLKPANVKLTPDGRVKVLDFGLAKALAIDPIPGNPASSPTLTMRATMAGIVIGTPAYMSPEQAKGKPVDRRADIWAFGILLAEMLTGRGMYMGETVSEVLAAVIMSEPEIPQSAPPQVRALLRRCLEKDPQFRLQAIGEARISLARPSEVPDTPRAEAAARRGAPWWALGAAAAIILVLAFFLWRATRPVDQPMERLSVDLGPDAVEGYFITAAISPDGTRIVFPVRSARQCHHAGYAATGPAQSRHSSRHGECQRTVLLPRRPVDRFRCRPEAEEDLRQWAARRWLYATRRICAARHGARMEISTPRST